MGSNNVIEYRSFDTTLEKCKKALERDGVAVIPGVLGEEELTNVREGMWT